MRKGCFQTTQSCIDKVASVYFYLKSAAFDDFCHFVVVLKQQAQKATNSEYVQGKMLQLKSLEQELQKKTLSVAEQIKQSEANLQAHEKAIAQQQQV